MESNTQNEECTPTEIKDRIKEFEEKFFETVEWKSFYKEYKPLKENYDKIYNFLKEKDIPNLPDVQIIRYNDDFHLVCYQDSFQIISILGNEMNIPTNDIYKFHLEYLKKRFNLFNGMIRTVGPLKGIENYLDYLEQ